MRKFIVKYLGTTDNLLFGNSSGFFNAGGALRVSTKAIRKNLTTEARRHRDTEKSWPRSNASDAEYTRILFAKKYLKPDHRSLRKNREHSLWIGGDGLVGQGMSAGSGFFH